MESVEKNADGRDSNKENTNLNPENPPSRWVSSRFKWLKQRPITFALLIGLLSLVYWASSTDEASPQASPFIATVDRGNIENTVTAAGNLQPSTYVDVGAQVSGKLEKLHVQIGDIVTQGQRLAEIEATVQINRVAASRASLKALQAQVPARNAALSLAKSNTDRHTRLLKENATAQADYDTAINALASAQANLIQLQSQITQSKASLASDEATLAFSSIDAPMDGTIVSISLKEGQTLNANQQAPTILRIADLNTMTVQGEVSEADVGKLKAKMNVYFTTLGGGNRRWHSSLRQVLPQPEVSNNVVLYTALFDIPNNDKTLLPDMTAQIFFVSASATNVVRVPVGALNFRDDNDLLKLGISRANTTNGKAISERTEGSKRNPGNDEPNQERPKRNSPKGDRQSQGNEYSAHTPRKATVIVVKSNGQYQPRTITVGVTTRVSAEVLDGLVEGDQVIAGIIQANSGANNKDRNSGFGGGPGGKRF